MTLKNSTASSIGGVALLVALTACGAATEDATTPAVEQPAENAAPAQYATQAAAEAAATDEPKNFSNAPLKPNLPPNSSESMLRMETYDRARVRNEFWVEGAVYTRFAEDRTYLDRYPVFTDLQCQMSHGAKTFWCAHGRMGEDLDVDIAKHVTFLYNEDVFAQQGEIACSQHLCITHDGLVAGALQPAMWNWMQEQCEFDDRNYFRCAN